MSTRQIPTVFLFLLIGAKSMILSGCASPEQQASEAPPPQQPQPSAEPPRQEKMRSSSAPTPSEVYAALQRVYKDAVTIDNSRSDYFVAGDFNGDVSQDLAVIVRPAKGKLAEINHELANWMRGDPLKISLPDPKARVRQADARPEPVRIEQPDVLLAVIHGYEAAGWRDPQATQTYLLRNAVGDNLRIGLAKDLLALRRGEKMPLIRGDVIRETLGGEKGYLYYNGATYAWYGPGTYKEDFAGRTVH